MSVDRDLTPAEEQLVALLELLRAERLEADEAMVEAVLRSARWQVVVRGAILLIDDLVGTVAGALGLVFADPSRATEDRS